eukprot:CAMPEP_0183357440 /NCGR_PEP_ID=MMETSP0164_2-20130417/46270_1 /TAXON_ID=221442 /ORGANISM="Coccolithus pelagicus ssp braarudi, Strain PLY182g" /LENGTH=63 /DNA_ID=CAMNT_0025531051 /DNA_START=42 /DNA_END=233 /DNA_ORIENTATION=+
MPPMNPNANAFTFSAAGVCARRPCADGQQQMGAYGYPPQNQYDATVVVIQREHLPSSCVLSIA